MLTEAGHRTDRGAWGEPGTWRARAFGLDLVSNVRIRGLHDAREGFATDETSVEVVSSEDFAASWNGEGAVRLLNESVPGESEAWSIHRHERFGYRLVMPPFGRYLIATDGRSILSSPFQDDEAAWRRVLIAQALPLAATLRGFEVLHASAVAAAGNAIAFLGPPEAGKTSIAAELLRRGFSLITDDVLALESTDAGPVLAQPGTRTVFVADQALAPIAGTLAGESDKKHLVVEQTTEDVLPLTAICLLERTQVSGTLQLEALPQPDPRTLLGSTFVATVRTPGRLTRQLDICARIATTASVVRATIPEATGVEQLASAIETWLADG